MIWINKIFVIKLNFFYPLKMLLFNLIYIKADKYQVR